VTQVLIQTKGFVLTPALQAACHKCSQKLLTRPDIGEKLEFFLAHEGKGDAKVFSVKIALSRAGRDIFIEEKAANMYQAIREACKKARLEFDDDD
jgi:ribosome-associated translation inhibitor RaiA